MIMRLNIILLLSFLFSAISSNAIDLASADNCYVNWAKGKVIFPSSQKCIETLVYPSYMTDNEGVIFSRDKLEIYAQRKDTKTYLLGCEMQEELFVTVLANGVSYGPYKIKSIEGSQDCPAYQFMKSYTFEFPDHVYSISSTDINKVLSIDEGSVTLLNNLSSEVSITFQAATYIKVKRGESNSKNRDDKTFVVKHPAQTIKYYNCLPGTITAYRDYTPKMPDSNNKYALYPKGDANSLMAIKIVNEESPEQYSTYNQTLKYSIKNNTKEIGKYEIQTTNMKAAEDANQVVGFMYSDINEYLNVGEVFNVDRQIALKGVNSFVCKTSTLSFEVVPEAFFENVNYEKRTVCGSNIPIEFNSSFSDYKNEKEWFYLFGEKLKFKNSSDVEVNLSSEIEKIYGIKYHWEYKTNNSIWKELPVYDGNNTMLSEIQYNCEEGFKNLPAQDLVVPNSLFKDGETYSFRQVATLEGFGKRQIVSNNSIEVKSFGILNKNNFVISPLGYKCADGELNEVTLDVKYQASDNAIFKKIDSSSLFRYDYSFSAAENTIKGTDLTQTFNVSSTTAKELKAEIIVSDGCNTSVNLSERLVFESQPELNPSDITCTNADISYDSDNNIVYVSIPEGMVGKLNVTRSLDEGSKYLYSTNDKEYSELNLRGLEFSLRAESQKKFFFKKKSNSGALCESNVVEINVVKIGSIKNNEFHNSLMYVCYGSKNPKITATEPVGGFQNGEYTYEWKYSTDNVTYSSMLDASSRKITGASLEEGQWDLPIAKKYFIKRVVTSKSGKGTINDEDACPYMTLVPYSEPTLTISSTSADGYVCYGEEVELSMSLDSEFRSQLELSESQNNVVPQMFGYAYKKGIEYKTIGDEHKDARTLPLTITQDSTIYAVYRFCNKEVISKPLNLKSGENLTPKMDEGLCRVRGKEMTVSVKNSDKSRSYTITQDKKEKGDITASLSVPVSGDVIYEVTVGDDKCVKTFEQKVSESQLSDAFELTELAVDGLPVKEVLLCAGTEHSVGNISGISHKKATSYSWAVNGLSVPSCTTAVLNYTFPDTGEEYKVVRTAYEVAGGKTCQSITESIDLNTYSNISGAVLVVGKSTVCEDEPLVVSISGAKGGSNSSYSYIVYDGEEVISQGTAKVNAVYEGTKLLSTSGSHTISAIVSDNSECSVSSKYSYETASVKVSQAESAAFTLTAEPSIVEIEAGEVKAISLTPIAENGDKVTEDLFSYSFSIPGGSMESEKPSKGAISLDVKSNYFTNDYLTINVSRTVGGTGCQAENSISVFKSSGFGDKTLSLLNSTITPLADKLEVCEGSKVELSVAELPAYNKKQLTPSDVTYAWYRNGSLIGKTEIYTATVSAGETATYLCKVSYVYDAAQPAAYIFSNEFKLVGKKGINLGNLYLLSNKSKSTSLCVGGAGEITLDVEANLEEGESLVWEESVDGKTWGEISDPTATKVGTRLGLSGSHYTSSNASVYYFRVTGISACGTRSLGKNIFTLNIESLPEAPVVALRSGNVVNGTVNELSFSPKNSYAGYSYEWGSVENDLDVQTFGSTYANVKGKFSIGENTVYVRKVSTTEGKCASAVVSYPFNLYKEITIGNIVDMSGNDAVRCPSEEKVILAVTQEGGTGEFETSWQYKVEGGEWISIIEGLTPFDVEFGDEVLFGKRISAMTLSGLKGTTAFRVLVSSTGNYTGDSKMSNEYIVKYYEPFRDKANGIDASEIAQCYGMRMDAIEGYLPEGGKVDADYDYQWYRTTTPQEEESWVAIPDATLQNYNGRDTLFATTYYRRIVTDGCGDKAISRNKRVEVKEPVFIAPSDVNYTAVVTSGNSAMMVGVPGSEFDDTEYVWYDSKWMSLDTTLVRKTYSTSPLSTVEDSKLFTFYAKKLKDECLSFNSDTLYITASNNTSGSIYINGTTEANEGKFWICSNSRDFEILSEKNPLNAFTYRWQYRVTTYALTSDNEEKVQTGNWSPVPGETKLYAEGVDLKLDTCNLDKSVLVNTTGRRKYVEFRRTAYFKVGDEEQSLESNIVTVNILPTMESVPFDVAGTISSKKTTYCKGEEGERVEGVADFDVLEVWTNQNKYFGPGLYDSNYNGGFYSWFEYSVDGKNYDTLSVISSAEENDYAKYFLPGEGLESIMNRTYHVRRAVSDGCTSAYSNNLSLTVIDKVGKASDIRMFGLESGKTDAMDRFYKGYEFGDSIVIYDESLTQVYDYMWSMDSLFTKTLETSKRVAGLHVGENEAVSLMSDPHIYMRRNEPDNECWSSYLQIPIAIGTESNGGTISGDQKICRGAEFSNIRNILSASGDWIAPTYSEMKWNYSWQWSKDSLTWANVDDANDIMLDAELVNKYVNPLNLAVGTTTYFRRVATNDSARVRVSNVAKLSYYDEFVPGELTDDSNGKIGYCSDEKLPVITTTLPRGGRTLDYGVGYTWKLSIDRGEYFTIPLFKDTFLILSVVDTLKALDLRNNVTISVMCEYSDGDDGCGIVKSECLNYILYRDNKMPNIYQDNDSCNASVVTIKVVPEKIEKTYLFGAFVQTDTGDSLTWSSLVDEITIKRVNTMIVDEYGVMSIDSETGCRSEYNYFNVDSLPELSQKPLSAPSAVCYGEDFTVEGGSIEGGNGKKTYTWQYSYDNEEWNVLSNRTDGDLEVLNPNMDIYYRRIVSDMCDTDTSNAVFIKVRKKVDVTKDVLIFNDFKCKNRMFNILTADSVKFTDTDYYLIWNSATGEETDTKSMGSLTVPGFSGDSLEMSLTHIVVDTAGMMCKSNPLTVFAHNAVAIDHASNVISCDNTNPCNGRYVEIEGESQRGVYSEKISYKWFVSNDKQYWSEQLLKTSKDMSLEAKDTMYIMRTANNGCMSDSSNVVTIVGAKVEDYDYVENLSLSVVSNMQDSSVTMSLDGGKSFASNYYFEGDGILPSISTNSTVLPYSAETYKDSILVLVAYADHCVSSYRMNPLRGGVISFDGDSVLCGGGDIPSIVSTNMEGGHGDYTYQWQYKNSSIPDFVDIEGATGKEYTPEAVSVETSYRRKTIDGEYISWSNVVKANIRPLPQTSNIYVSVGDSILDAYSLKYSEFSVEKVPSMDLSLRDSVSDADSVVWEQSYDNDEWVEIFSQAVVNNGVVEYLISDTAQVSYYRVKAVSGCGTSVSKAFKVTTLYASVIMDEELVLTDSICSGDQFARIKFKKELSDIYEYSYEAINYEGSGVFERKSSVRELDHPYGYYSGKESLSDTAKVSSGAIFTYPKHSFDVVVTRWVKSTGASSRKLIHFFVDDFSAKFSYVVDGMDSHNAGEPVHSVRLNQGSRVVFTPEVESGLEDLSYKWSLIAPKNTDYYEKYGGSVGREGLTSEKESPVCYFYNGGDYYISMTVSDGLCSAVVKDSSLYINSQDTRGLRVYTRSASFDEEWFDFTEYGLSSHSTGYVEVNPTNFKDFFTIYTDENGEQSYELFNTAGTKVLEGRYVGTTTVMTEGIEPGVYMLYTAGNVVKLVKTKK